MGARAHDGLERADGGDAAALVVMRAHPPDPTVLELGPVRVDGPPTHLDAWVHVAVYEKCRPPAAPFEPPNRLPTLLFRIEWVDDLLHLHLEADVGHVVGVEVRDIAFFEGRAWDADRPLLEIEDPLLIDRSKCRPRVDC